MEKRGQVTIFVILGIVIVALVVLLFAFREDIVPSTGAENLNSILNDIDKHIKDCMEGAAEGPLERIALQGGYLSVPPESYRLWNDNTISYLCYDQPGVEWCMNRLLTREHMEEELAAAIKEEMLQCVDVEGVAGGIIKRYDIIVKPPMELAVTITGSTVLLELNYPVTLKSSEATASETTFTVPIEKPLGELYDVAQDILEGETSIGRFDTLTYMLSKMSKYTIYLHKPYPDKIYQVKLREGDYMFQFAVEGEPS